MDAAHLGIAGIVDPVEIDRGASAIVYRAFQPNFRRSVAVKVLSVSAVDGAVKAAFERECQAMGSLSDHPNIVTVHDSGYTDAGRPYLVMAYLPNGSLAARLAKDGPLPPGEVLEIGVKVADALDAAHRLGVLHRDVKPSNILLSNSGEPQLADFGIARLTDATVHSRTGWAFTPAYAAPEVLDRKPPSPANDVYSLGASLFELLAGKPAFVGDPEEGIYPLISRVPTEPVPDLRPGGVPDALAATIERAMAKNPTERTPSAAAFAADLRAARDDGQSVGVSARVDAMQDRREGPVVDGTPPPAAPPWPPPAHVRPRLWQTAKPVRMLLVCGALVLVIGTVALVARQNGTARVETGHATTTTPITTAGTNAQGPPAPGATTAGASPAGAFPLLAASRSEPPGREPKGITSDGRNLWISSASTQVFKTEATGKPLDSFDAPDGTPGGIVWVGDGFYLYTTNSNSILRLSADGRLLGSFKSPASSIGPETDMAWDGENLWFAAQAKLVRMSPDGVVQPTGSLTFRQDLAGVEWDGTSLWLAQNNFPCSAFAPCQATLRRVDRSGTDLACFRLPVAWVLGIAIMDRDLFVLGRESVSATPSIFRIAIPTQRNECQ